MTRCVFSLQVVVFDGGEYVSMAGEFNEFRKVQAFLCLNVSPFFSSALDQLLKSLIYLFFQVPNEMWDQMEAMIRKTKGS